MLSLIYNKLLATSLHYGPLYASPLIWRQKNTDIAETLETTKYCTSFHSVHAGIVQYTLSYLFSILVASYSFLLINGSCTETNGPGSLICPVFSVQHISFKTNPVVISPLAVS